MLGEYAVLEGAPAVLSPVNRFVTLTATQQTSACISIRLCFVPNQWQEFAFADINGLLASSEPDLALVRAAFRQAAKSELQLPNDGFALDLSSAEFTDPASRQKLGLGSSAAASVALATWLLQASESDCKVANVVAFAHALHTQFQGGVGSGADLVTSAVGAPCAVFPKSGGAPDFRGIVLPDNLFIMPIWSGSSASTPGLVKRFRRWQTEGGSAASQIANLCQLSKDGLLALQSGNAQNFIAVCDDYTALLASIGSASGLPIVTTAAASLHELAREHGGICKPSGAGGGDFCLFMTTFEEGLRTFRQALQPHMALSESPRLLR